MAAQPIPQESGLGREELLRLYYFMRLTRTLEERLVILKRQSRIVGGVYRSLGQEAETVGAASALDRSAGDMLCPMIRNLGAILVQGATAVEILRQNLTRETAATRGRDQSFHFSDLERGFIGHIANLGDMVSVMAGVALAAKIRGERRAVLMFSGDGTASTGAFHEGTNFAAAQRLPMVVIVENNGYAYSTPTSRETAVPRLADKAKAYGIPDVTVDGNDVLAVYRATRAALARARAGEGASMIEVVTYRLLGHAEHDDQSYVSPDELARWALRDPLALYRDHLISAGWAQADRLSAMDDEIHREILDALAMVESELEVPALAALGQVWHQPARQEPEWYRRIN